MNILLCRPLEDAADLESIEEVANEVLAMQMPTTPAQLQNLTNEIRERVGDLSHVETILNQSADDIQRAESLLEQARRARYDQRSHARTWLWASSHRPSDTAQAHTPQIQTHTPYTHLRYKHTHRTHASDTNTHTHRTHTSDTNTHLTHLTNTSATPTYL